MLWQKGNFTFFPLFLKYIKPGNIKENTLVLLQPNTRFSCFYSYSGAPYHPRDYMCTVLIPKKSHDMTKQGDTIRSEVVEVFMNCGLGKDTVSLLSLPQAFYSQEHLILVDGQVFALQHVRGSLQPSQWSISAFSHIP